LRTHERTERRRIWERDHGAYFTSAG